MGPGNVLEKLRYWVGVRYGDDFSRYGVNIIAEAFTCMWCLSVWVSMVIAMCFYLFPAATGWLAMPLALSAAAIIVDRIVNKV